MVAATAAMKLDKNQYRFGAPKFVDDTPSPKVVPTQPALPATPSRPIGSAAGRPGAEPHPPDPDTVLSAGELSQTQA